MPNTKLSPPEKKQQDGVYCAHCGDKCPSPPLQSEGKNFCCPGCQMVYAVILANGLENYYCLNEMPGTSQKSPSEEGKYAFLDDAQISRQLLDFSDGKMAKVTLYLPQVHCASCVWLLEKLPALHKGITHARINFLRKEISITFLEQKISLHTIANLLAKVGYAPLISLNDLEKKKQKPFTQTGGFYLRLGITGFCFGNIMLLSFPEYLGLESTREIWGKVFGYLNILLALPIFFYGASPYWKSALAALRHKSLNIDVPISLGILALFGRSLYEILSHTGAGYLDSLGSLVFLLLIGRWFQHTTFSQISFVRDYRSYFPIAVLVKKGDEEKSKSLVKLKKKDHIVLRHGELVPADAVLICGEALIDYSFVTGESEPVYLSEGEKVYAGGRQKAGRIELVLEKEVSQSYLTRLWNAQAFKDDNTPKISDLTSKMGQYFTLAIILIASISAAYWSIYSPATAVNVFTAVLIIACPCALALNVPFTLGNALRILGRAGFYLKETAVIEKMARLNHLVFDKTGTLTEGGDSATGHYEGKTLTEAEKSAVFSLASESTHPMSIAVSKYLSGASKQKVSHFREVSGQGISGKVNGAEVRIGKRTFVGGEEEGASSRIDETDKQAKGGEVTFRSATYLGIGGEEKGCFYTKQKLRNALKNVLESLRKKMRLSLLSGDHEGEKTRLSAVFRSGEPMLFRQSPAQKMAYIRKLQATQKIVGMVGDGLNDAGGLKQSDVGIALSNNINQFSPACDGILSADKFQQLPFFLQFSRRSVRLVYGGFVLSLLYNVVGLSFAVQGLLSPLVAAILMPLSSITIVLFGTIGTWAAAKTKT